jgi:hypothetical protein
MINTITKIKVMSSITQKICITVKYIFRKQKTGQHILDIRESRYGQERPPTPPALLYVKLRMKIDNEINLCK